jgi:hypothetical protein
MRSDQRTHSSPESPPRPANAKRRGFLLALGLGGAGAAAIAARSLSDVAATDATDSAASSDGYRLTDHVKRYYQTTKT